MFKNIFLPTDGSDLSRKAVLYGVQLAKLTGGKVIAFTVRAPYVVSSLDAVAAMGSQGQFEEETKQYAARALEQAKMAGEAAGVPVETLEDVNDQPFRAIVDAAEANRCDLIVMASHGRRGVSALLLGSETNKVLTHSKIPVLVYR
jgi:nucleotide-binding universal stress UspA family protein